MSTEENKAVFHRFYDEVLSQGRLEVLEELGASAFVDHNPIPGEPPGLEGVRCQFDNLGLLQQLGVIPVPGQATS